MTTKRDIENQIEYARNMGIEAGYKKGREDEAREKSLEIAKAMLARGLDISVVAECTGLPAEEIAQL